MIQARLPPPPPQSDLRTGMSFSVYGDPGVAQGCRDCVIQIEDEVAHHLRKGQPSRVPPSRQPVLPKFVAVAFEGRATCFRISAAFCFL